MDSNPSATCTSTNTYRVERVKDKWLVQSLSPLFDDYDTGFSGKYYTDDGLPNILRTKMLALYMLDWQDESQDWIPEIGSRVTETIFWVDGTNYESERSDTHSKETAEARRNGVRREVYFCEHGEYEFEQDDPDSYQEDTESLV